MAPSWFSELRRLNRNNLATVRAAPWAEISGSLGDLGTLLPLMIALAAQGSIHLGTTLVFSGLFNILTGVFYGIPLPVQPMKVSDIMAREQLSQTTRTLEDKRTDLCYSLSRPLPRRPFQMALP